MEQGFVVVGDPSRAPRAAAGVATVSGAALVIRLRRLRQRGGVHARDDNVGLPMANARTAREAEVDEDLVC